MTPDQARALKPIFDAYCEGKVVQFQTPEMPNHWHDYIHYDRPEDEVLLLHPRLKWRIKPEPRRWWVCPVCDFACVCNFSGATLAIGETASCAGKTINEHHPWTKMVLTQEMLS